MPSDVRHRRSTPWPTEPRSVFFDDVASRPVLTQAIGEKRIRRLAPRVYTADLRSAPFEIIAENRWQILARALPGAVIADRSAAEEGRIVSGRLFVVSDRHRHVVRLPGLEIRVRPGQPFESPVPDLPWADGLRMSSPARILLDNLAESRSRGGQTARTLSLAELEDWLARKALAWGADRLDRLRRDTVLLAEATGATHQLARVEQLFDQVSGRVPPRSKAGQLLVAYTERRAWDEGRLLMFERAARDLVRVPSDQLPEHLPPPGSLDASPFYVESSSGVAGLEQHLSSSDIAGLHQNLPESWGELPFYESYFSNFIEGTEFTVEEARSIVEAQRPPSTRPADGHDILGTYRCVTDPVGHKATSDDPDVLVGYLLDRHRTILAGRPSLGPGRWKTEPNRVGAYPFVAPELVEGTLRRGLALLARLSPGICRAMYVMLVVSEVHPFADGNGRVARLMMNAELSSVGASRIVIPTVYRDEYIGGLRRASLRDGDIAGLVQVMVHAWRWTAAMPWADQASLEGQLVATNALQDPATARELGFRLELS